MSIEHPRASVLGDRERTGRILFVVGVVGLVGALVTGGAGWFFAGRALGTVTETLAPIAAIVVNVEETIDASLVMVDQTTAAIESIESATRSTARTLDSVSEVIADTSEIVGGDVADGLDAAVDTLPALADTGRVIDRTMRTLSLVGVDYDPEVPLDESLTQLEESLRPLPDQLRAQVALLAQVQEDVDQIAVDTGTLTAVLLETRIDMMEVTGVLESAAENTASATESIDEIRTDISTYDTLARVIVVAGTLALIAAAATPLLLGLHYRRSAEATR